MKTLPSNQPPVTQVPRDRASSATTSYSTWRHGHGRRPLPVLDAQTVIPHKSTRRRMGVRLNGARLRLELVRRGLDQSGLAKRAKLRPETISRAVTGRRVRSSTISAIAAALMEAPVRHDIAALLAEVANDPPSD
jgi:hypothetical protein